MFGNLKFFWTFFSFFFFGQIIIIILFWFYQLFNRKILVMYGSFLIIWYCKFIQNIELNITLYVLFYIGQCAWLLFCFIINLLSEFLSEKSVCVCVCLVLCLQWSWDYSGRIRVCVCECVQFNNRAICPGIHVKIKEKTE